MKKDGQVFISYVVRQWYGQGWKDSRLWSEQCGTFSGFAKLKIQYNWNNRTVNPHAIHTFVKFLKLQRGKKTMLQTLQILQKTDPRTVLFVAE